MIKTHFEKNILSWLLLNTLAFILFQTIFSLANHRQYLHETGLFYHQVPWTVYPEIIFTIFLALFFHVLATFCVWLISSLNSFGIGLAKKYHFHSAFSLWLITLCCLILGNQIYFPISQFSSLTDQLVPLIISKILWVLFLIFLAGYVLGAVYGLLKIAVRYKSSALCAIGIIAVIVLLTRACMPGPINHIANPNKPNVIIIGIDSLRPDYMAYYGAPQKLMPQVENFLQHATNFTQAITPLARTYCAWVSILTGKYPKTNGATEDLTPPQLVDLSWTLAKTLHHQGYYNVYATDETRFSNIDSSFGFDQTLGPKTGFNNFMLGYLDDFPLLNILTNTDIGEVLFPYNFINRQALVTYFPHSFSHYVTKNLARVPNKPLFFAVHFCLPHYPYGWSTKLKYDAPPDTSTAAKYLYSQALAATDQQFVEVMDYLKAQHFLDNAIVLVLSDHGEALGDGDRLTARKTYIPAPHNAESLFIKNFFHPELGQPSPTFTAGHGTDILSLAQYHIVLSWRLYGSLKNIHRDIPYRISLPDIAPTIMSLLHLSSPLGEGIALTNFLLQPHYVTPPARNIYVTSGYSPYAQSIHPSESYILSQSSRYFYIDPVSQVSFLKPTAFTDIEKRRQYGIMRGQWFFALYQTRKMQAVPVIVNLLTGQWSDRMTSPLAMQSPALSMFHQLKAYYGHEIPYILTQ